MRRIFSLGSFLAALSFAGAAAQNPEKAPPYKNVAPAEFEKLAKQPKHVILDVRTPAEFAKGHIAGAINIDVNAADFQAKVGKLDKETTYLVHCASGGRSVTACERLTTLSFAKLYNLEGGIRAWTKAGKPLETGDRQPAVVEIWPGKVPEEPGTIDAEKTVMSPKLTRKDVEVTESTRMITNVTKPTLTIYRPAKDKDNGAAVVICPGGGYWNLYWELEGEEVAAWLNSMGVTGIILKYRVPRRPDEIKGEPARRPLQDAQRAVSLIRSKAKEWGIDGNRIGMVGFSAGGHLAIATATSFEKRTYERVDDVDKVSSRPDFAILAYSGYLKAKDKDALAPGLSVPAGTPPVFLVHGSDDIISPPEHSVQMYLALKRAGVPAELHLYANTSHDFGVRAGDRPYSAWTQACEQWMRSHGFLKRP
jgi:acetyl esterase/lipase